MGALFEVNKSGRVDASMAPDCAPPKFHPNSIVELLGHDIHIYIYIYIYVHCALGLVLGTCPPIPGKSNFGTHEPLDATCIFTQSKTMNAQPKTKKGTM